jgi:hypothetical protein
MTARGVSAPRATVLLLRAAAVLLASVLVLSILLEALPGREPFLSDTISTDAHGPHGGLVFAILLLFGLGTASVAASLGLRLRGRAGVVCGLLVAVWAGAAIFDAFVRTPRVHVGTAFGQVHTMAAVAGIVAQMLVALILLGVTRRRDGRVAAPLRLVTAAVLAGGVFVAVHPNSLAGLSERLLFAASAAWMLVSVRSVRSPGEPLNRTHRLSRDHRVGMAVSEFRTSCTPVAGHRSHP